MRSRVSQAHATGAPTTADNPLQQCVAFTRRTGPARIVATDVVRQLPSVRHELVPVEVSRVGILETDRPILRRDGYRPDPVTAGLPPQRVRAPPAIDVGTSIGRVLQDVGSRGHCPPVARQRHAAPDREAVAPEAAGCPDADIA